MDNSRCAGGGGVGGRCPGSDTRIWLIMAPTSPVGGEGTRLGPRGSGPTATRIVVAVRVGLIARESSQPADFARGAFGTGACRTPVA